MLTPQNPRHVLITGGSSGIGAALAALYAAKGIRLSLHGRNRERLTHVAAMATAAGADVTIWVGDVTDAAMMAAWVQDCDQHQPIDLMIANAGISAGTRRGGESAVQARAVFTTNVIGVINSVSPAISLMIGRRRGQIAIVSSLASFRGLAGAPSYGASKAAVRLYGEALRSEMAPHNVAVSVVCPGFVKTPMTAVNRFPMPFVMNADHAARIIRNGLARNRSRIAFPWPMYALVWLLQALPPALVDLIVARLPKKGS
jgi:short-subunit dehydrogenase